MSDVTGPNKTNMRYVYVISIVAAIGGLLFGYDTAVISGAIGNLQTKFNLSSRSDGRSCLGSHLGLLWWAFFLLDISVIKWDAKRC